MMLLVMKMVVRNHLHKRKIPKREINRAQITHKLNQEFKIAELGQA